jgi:DNA polymerase III epsilon subunit-like protein
MNNITFDLETLGNTKDAPIVQIGAVKFTDEGEVTDKFVRRIKASSLEQYDFHIDYSTVFWWLNQSKEAQESVFEKEPRMGLRQALYEFTKWIGKASKYVYWSHATFDPPILNNNIAKVGIDNPIPFRNHRDIRTLTHFTGKIETERVGTHHDALDDCIFQAKYISKGLRALNKFKETKMKYIEQ